jgi:hypothetical protein
MLTGAVLVITGAVLLEVPLGLRDAAIAGCAAAIGALLIIELVRRDDR